MKLRRIFSLLMTLVMIMGTLPLSVFTANATSPEEVDEAAKNPENAVSAVGDSDVNDYPEINVGEQKTAVINEPGEAAYFRFTPEKDGCYILTSYSYDDTVCTLYDVNGDYLKYDDDGGEGYDFRLSYDMTAGVTYIYECRYYSEYTGSYTVELTKAADAESVYIVGGDSIVGYVGTGVQLTAEFEPSNARRENLTWTSSDESVASVSNDGYVYFIREGSVFVTVTSERGLTASCTVTVVPIPEINLGEIKNVDIIFGGEYAYFTFTPEEDGFYSFYSMSHSDTFGSVLDAVDCAVIASDDDGGEDMNFNVKCHMSAGVTYLLKAGYFDDSATGSFTVCVEKTIGVEKLEIVSLPDPVEWSINGYSDSILYGMTLKATLTDQREIYWTYGEDGDYIDGQRVRISYYPDGDRMAVNVYCGIARVSFTLDIIGNPIDRIETVNPEVIPSLTENTNGNWNHRYNPETGSEERYFYYYMPDISNLMLRVYYTDGTDKTVYAYEDLDGYCIDWTENQYEKPWTLGSDNYIEGRYMGRSVFVPITIVEGPVERIEVVDPSVIPDLIEHTGGDWTYGYNPITGVEEYYYRYSIPNTGDITVRIYYTDGTVRIANLYEPVDDGCGCFVELHDMQNEAHWTVGSDNYIEIMYMNRVTYIPVTILENPVDRIEIINPEDVEPLVEYMNGYWETYYDQDAEMELTRFRYELPSLHDIMVRVYFTDGTSETAPVYGEINGWYIEAYDRQYRETWGLGSDNYIYISCLGAEAALAVTIVENPVERIEVVDPSVIPDLIEHTGGDWTYGYNPNTGMEEYYYRYSIPNTGDITVRIYYTDGTVRIANLYEPVDDGCGCFVELHDMQNEAHWTVGSDNYIGIMYMNRVTYIPVTILENPVDRIEIINPEDVEPLVEYMNGYWETYYDQDAEMELTRFRYELPSLHDIMVRVYFTDGTSETAPVYGEINGWYIEAYDRQYRETWGLGSDNYIYISCLGAEAALAVTIVENPVERIEIVDPSVIDPIVEHDRGYWDTYYNWETETSEEYFYYYIPNLYGLAMRIYYTDGSEKIASFGEELDGYYFTYINRQYETHWTLGSDNYLEITYMGRSAFLPITIIESSVDHIEVLNPYVVGVLYENTAGVWNYDYESSYFCYYEPTGLSDLLVRIWYTDGTSVTGGMYDYIDGHRIECNDNQYRTHWYVGSDNYYEVTYMGKSAFVPVTVLENPVDYIVIDTAPTRVYTYGDPRYGYVEPDGSYYFAPSDLSGLEFTVYYYDGSHRSYSFSDIDGARIDGQLFSVSYVSDNYNPEIGYFTMAFEYMGRVAYYDVLIESPEATYDIMGDINHDGLVNAVDLLMFKKYLAGDINGDGLRLDLVDFDGNGKLNALDYAILKFVVGL